jgi:hypothetical protein
MKRADVKVMKYTIVLFALLTACGSAGSGSGASATGTKALFTKWNGVTNPGTELDLTGMTFNTQRIIQLKNSLNTGCYCNVTVSGSESSGTATMNGCYPYGGAQCNPTVTVLTYTNASGALSICYSGSCTSYN